LENQPAKNLLARLVGWTLVQQTVLGIPTGFNQSARRWPMQSEYAGKTSGKIILPRLVERGKGRGEEPKQRGIDVGKFSAHTRRMAKKSEVKSATETPRRRVGKQTADAGSQKSDSLRASVPLRQKPSALLDTRVIYCGDNLEQLAKLPDACDSAFRNPHSAIALAGSFYYRSDWHASHYVKVMLDQIF
jgi:hypothetical protein